MSANLKTYTVTVEIQVVARGEDYAMDHVEDHLYEAAKVLAEEGGEGEICDYKVLCATEEGKY